MDDDAIFRQQLERRIAGYRTREHAVGEHIAELEAELADVRRRRESAERLYVAEFGSALPESATQDSVPRGRGERQLTVTGPLTGLSWGDAIVRVLDENGPAHIKEIWRLLEEGGFRTDARDPLRSIVAIALRLEPAVFRVAPNTYALGKGRPSGRVAEPEQTQLGGLAS